MTKKKKKMIPPCLLLLVPTIEATTATISTRDLFDEEVAGIEDDEAVGLKRVFQER